MLIMGPKHINCTTPSRTVCGSLQLNNSGGSFFTDKKMPSSFDEKILAKNENIQIKPKAGQRLRRCSTKNFESAKQPMIMLEQWFRQRLANWVQCGGHEGTILPATETTIWKKRVCKDFSYESNAYAKLMKDICCNLVPKFYQEILFDGNFYMELEDLTKQFKSPSIMDIKIGERTFLESEVNNSVKRRDLYEKMVAIDPTEPTDQENEERAITKLRYMQFRERESSSSSLGFRIEAAKKRTGKAMTSNFTKCKTKSQLVDVFDEFFACPNKTEKRKMLIRRLKHMKMQIENSPFFKTHEVIGSSLLIMYDDNHVDAWLIDFAKTVPLPEGTTVTHRTKWQIGNREDGYLTGMDNIIEILESDKPA